MRVMQMMALMRVAVSNGHWLVSVHDMCEASMDARCYGGRRRDTR